MTKFPYNCVNQSSLGKTHYKGKGYEKSGGVFGSNLYKFIVYSSFVF